jgi:hypothetical protein
MTTQSISGERKTFAASQECWPNVPDRAARDVFNDRKDETRRYKPLFSIVMFFALTAASLAQQVKTDYDHNANFSQYKTYSWEKAQTRDPLFVHRIKDAVNGAVPVKGWTQVDSGGDVSIAAIEIAQNKQDLNTIYDGFGGGVLEDSATQRLQLKPTRSAISSSIRLTPRPRI